MNQNLEQYKNITIVPQQEFVDVIPTMYAPFEAYITKLFPLMLQHGWQEKQSKKFSSLEALLHSGWICRLITLDKRVLDPEKQNEIPYWPEIRDRLINSLDECKEESHLSKMISDCMQLLMPILQKRVEKNYHFPERNFYCWWYTMHDEDTHLALHLVNAYQPQSPFRHLQHFLTTMLQAVEHALKNYPAIKIVSCGSWLNQLPKFQKLWPESFKQNQKVLNETGGLGPGAWGQYMTTDGGFNEEKAAVLESTGRHPFALTEAQCSLSELVVHLEKIISSTILER
jgi:hypothetical protein